LRIYISKTVSHIEQSGEKETKEHDKTTRIHTAMSMIHEPRDEEGDIYILDSPPESFHASAPVYKVWKSHQNNLLNNSNNNTDGMDIEEEVDIKLLIDKVLQDLDMGDKRAQKLDQVDFLKILFAFNKVGIHFA